VHAQGKLPLLHVERRRCGEAGRGSAATVRHGHRTTRAQGHKHRRERDIVRRPGDFNAAALLRSGGRQWSWEGARPELKGGREQVDDRVELRRRGPWSKQR
jgi:hypothetical protein